MSSLRRTIARNGADLERQDLRGIKTDDEWLELQLFGEKRAATEEIQGERTKLVERLKKFAAGMPGGPERVWPYLLEARRGYDPHIDGASEGMSIVDDVKALNEIEREPCN